MLPLVARGQRFLTGFGMNSQLRASRELTEKTDRTVGGNREQKYHYRLTLENYGEQAVMVRLYDRIPAPMDRADIRGTLGEMSDPLSEDPLHLEREKPHGILRWNIELAANSARATARKVEYEYTLEFDRKLMVVTPDAAGEAEKAKAQFEGLILDRARAQ